MGYIDPGYLEHQRKRFTRNNAQLYIRHDAWRFAPPGAPRYSGKDVVRYFEPEAGTDRRSQAAADKAAQAAAEFDAAERERLALQRSLEELRLELAAIKRDLLLRKAFNPNQPRVASGNTGGGQWTSDGASTDISGQRRRGGRGTNTPLQQQLRLEMANVRAQQALARVREIDPNWRVPQSITRQDSVEGIIRAKQAEAQAADARYFELLRSGSNPENRAVAEDSSGKPLRDILAPNGEPAGVRDPGAGKNVRTVPPEEFEQIRTDLLSGAQLTRTPRDYPGVWRARPDGTVVGLRVSRGGLAIDIIESSDKLLPRGFKVHQR
jgi:hypothetical protein